MGSVSILHLQIFYRANLNMLILLFSTLLIGAFINFHLPLTRNSKTRSAPTFAALCSDRIVNTIEQIVSPTGYKFNVTTSTCISSPASDKRAIKLETRLDSVVDKRSASECTTPDCVCGTACKLFSKH